jgi:predicted nucleic acid-binding protein
MPGNFIDTNVLIYFAASTPEKANRAEAVIAAGGFISVQVLNEVANVARRKMRLSWPELRSLSNTLRSLLTIREMTVETHEIGMRIAERYGLSIYDAMIAASALQADCDVLWSEDMQHGLLINRRLRIANPFIDEQS